MKTYLMPLRFLLAAPFALVALTFFAAYFTCKNSSWGHKRVNMVIPAVLFGLPSVLTNIIWNLVFATFLYWEFPRFPAGEKWSPFFSSRLGSRLARGDDDPTTRWFIWAVSMFDNDHFGGFRGDGPNPFLK